MCLKKTKNNNNNNRKTLSQPNHNDDIQNYKIARKKKSPKYIIHRDRVEYTIILYYE